MTPSRALACSLLLALAACGGKGGGTGPSTMPPEPTYSVTSVVFYDENGNGVLDGAEAVRLQQVDVVVGGVSAKSGAGGQAVVAGVKAGAQTVAIRTESLPAYFVPTVPLPVQVPQTGGEVRLAVRLPIGDNLPNENEIREKYGSKNFLLLGSSHALAAASAAAMNREFAGAAEEQERARKYGEEAEDLLVAMHEVIGHGSGKLSDRVKAGAQPFLKEYYSTLEEARADLMALFNVWDPKLKELGLVTDQENVARAMYDSSARAALTQLRRIPKGDTIEEDHQRARALIANFVKDKTGAIEQFNLLGKTFVRVTDYQKMREGVGVLLAELMRIKAEGDYDAVKALIDKYGVHFDPKLRDQVVGRYRQLDLPVYWAGINPELTAQLDAKGNVSSIKMTYPRDAVQQYLSYGRMYQSK